MAERLAADQVAHQVVDQVVAVLGEDRLGVELDAAVVRAAHAGGRLRSRGPPRPRRRRAATRPPAPRTCCRSRPARSRRRSRPATACPGTRCPCTPAAARAADTEPGGRGTPRGTACCRASSRSTAARSVAIFGVVVVTRVAGTGPDDDQVGVIETPLDVRVVPHHVAGHAEHAQHVAQHVHEVVLAVEDHARAGRAAPDPAAPPPGRSARTSRAGRCGSSARSARPRRGRATATSSAGTGAGGTSPKALRMPLAFACVSATSYAASESRTSVAPADTLSRPSGSTSAVRIRIGLSTVGRPSGSRPNSASAAP